MALVACGLGYACGQAVTRRSPPLAPAGSPRDDGSGILARISSGAGLDRKAPARRPAASAAEGQAVRVAATYGGARYANYRFERSPRTHMAPLPYTRRYVPVAPAEFGSIAGVVLWPHPPRAPERLPARSILGSGPGSGSGSGCRSGLPNRSLALAGGGALANAVVYLEDIPTGRLLLGRMNSSYPNPTKHMQTGGVLEWRDCHFHPQVQIIAPIGSVLSMMTADEPIQVSATRVDGRARESLWTVPLGARGATHEHLLEREGFLELRAEREGLAATSWVVVAAHPYFAITDERGHFALDEVPPGSYTLVVWHEPVVVGYSRTGEPLLHASPPIRRRVVVRARQGQTLVIRLQPAR